MRNRYMENRKSGDTLEQVDGVVCERASEAQVMSLGRLEPAWQQTGFSTQ